uniref:Aldehyde-activating protein n=1 Tax=Vibrio ziniensis TaxID=2711221 RepID=A0A6G7CQX1_9VIBR|nr:aldehyde-activating protein [Vibrio ziniensis]
MLTGHCHCGNITLKIPHLSKTATECNCSICSRYAAIWGYFKDSEVKIITKENNVGDYSWGDKDIIFHHCTNCGCITHYSSANKSNSERVAVNYRMFNPTILTTIKIRHFDGAVSWTYID